MTVLDSTDFTIVRQANPCRVLSTPCQYLQNLFLIVRQCQTHQNHFMSDICVPSDKNVVIFFCTQVDTTDILKSKEGKKKQERPVCPVYSEASKTPLLQS